MWEATYQIAPNGLATSFTETELPLEYAARFRNRFINAAGGAEKRPGIVQLGDDVPGSPKIDGLHELVKKDGTVIFFASGAGKIWRLDGSTWAQVHSLTGMRHIQSVQMGDKLIFCNSANPNFYTEDGTNFYNLQAIIESGQATTGTSSAALRDSGIVNWVSGTDVVANDLVYYIDRSGYAVITAVGTAEVSHTVVSTAGAGFGLITNGSASSGDRYRIIDMVEQNVIPTSDPSQPDNVAVATSGTSSSVVAVSGVDFSTAGLRGTTDGDVVLNTTKNAAAFITDIPVSASDKISITPISGQASGDSLVFLKPAMPTSSFLHVHYGRLYHIDARDKKKVRISGVGDPTDMTTDAGTIDSNSFNFGDLQPRGDSLLAIASYQNFLGILGKQNLYLYSGIDPIDSSSTANDADFTPVALFPQGGLSELGLLSIGNDLCFVTHDGVQTITQVQDQNTLNRANLTEPLRKTLRQELRTEDPNEVQLIHYPERSWLLLKVGSLLYCYNYSAFVGQKDIPQGGDKVGTGSWALFDGKFARCHAFYLRADGTLVCGGDGGKVYEFDQGTYDDDGDTITTEYQTGWLQVEEDVRIKQGKYIKPQIQSGENIAYTIRAEAPFSIESSETIMITASGNSAPIGLWVIGDASIGAAPVANTKYPLRWRGEAVRLTFMTDDIKGPDILGRYTLYGTMGGRE